MLFVPISSSTPVRRMESSNRMMPHSLEYPTVTCREEEISREAESQCDVAVETKKKLCLSNHDSY